jgi:SPP1 family predicted phage head-tail adaptor
MRAGRLRRRVTIEARVAAQSTIGQPNGAWTSQFSAWAAIEPLSGRELIAAAAAQSEVTHRVTLRYREGKAVTSAMRVNYGGRLFNIHAVRIPEEDKRAWILDCTEGNDGGGQ